MLIQLVVRPMSRLPPAWPSQRGALTVVKTRSIELLAILLEMFAVTPIGREPSTKLPEPDLLPYLIKGNWPSWGVASARLIVMGPLTARAPATFTGASDGFPNAPRSTFSEAAVEVAKVKFAMLN